MKPRPQGIPLSALSKADNHNGAVRPGCSFLFWECIVVRYLLSCFQLFESPYPPILFFFGRELLYEICLAAFSCLSSVPPFSSFFGSVLLSYHSLVTFSHLKLRTPTFNPFGKQHCNNVNIIHTALPLQSRPFCPFCISAKNEPGQDNNPTRIHRRYQMN